MGWLVGRVLQSWLGLSCVGGADSGLKICLSPGCQPHHFHLLSGETQFYTHRAFHPLNCDDLGSGVSPLTGTEGFLTARTFSATAYSMKNASLYLVSVHMGKYPTTCMWWSENDRRVFSPSTCMFQDQARVVRLWATCLYTVTLCSPQGTFLI